MKRCYNDFPEEGNLGHEDDCLSIFEAVGAYAFDYCWVVFALDILEYRIGIFFLVHINVELFILVIIFLPDA